MNQNTPQDRINVAAKVIADRGDAFVIETRDELLEVISDYALAEYNSRAGEPRDDVDARRIERVGMLYADLTTEQLEHNLDALLFILKRYRGER